MKPDDMRQTLLDAERSLFMHSITCDRSRLEAILHERFHEMGKSGILFDRTQVIESLHQLKQDRLITIYNFSWEEITPDVYLIHYITKETNPQTIYRTSVWINEQGLRLYFHQASVMHTDTTLCEA